MNPIEALIRPDNLSTIVRMVRNKYHQGFSVVSVKKVMNRQLVTIRLSKSGMTKRIQL